MIRIFPLDQQLMRYHRSPVSLHTPLLEENKPSACESSSFSRPPPFYNLPGSPLSTETFFDVPSTPDAACQHDCHIQIHGHGAAPRMPLKMIHKVIRRVFPSKSEYAEEQALVTNISMASRPKPRDIPPCFSESLWL